MFDLLKKKISSFVDGFLKKEKKKEEAQVKEKAEQPRAEERPQEIKEKQEQEKIEKKPPEPKPELPAYPRVHEEKKREASLGLFDHVKSIFTGEIEISRQNIGSLLETLELDLLEADVSLDVAAEIKQELEQSLIGKKVKKSELNSFIRNAIRSALIHIAQNEKIFDVLENVENAQTKPVKIMFIGPNGSGKTTTISKIAKLLLSKNKKVVFAAADTFRAAAVEQIDVHAERLGIKTIKREYGSDPTAVAYDAVNYARAHNIDVVLIDTAGRQDTNLNLINELKKMNRVIQPDMKIYVGESIAGNAIVDQVTRFHKEIGIDGIILTKLDCDPKGGTVLSLSKLTGVPIIYIGTGQGYEDLEKFDAEKIVDSILS